jgi:hypothetical protein
MNASSFVEAKHTDYEIGRSFEPYTLMTAQVKVLHYLACILLTIERHTNDRNIEYSYHLIGERLTLKYF